MTLEYRVGDVFERLAEIPDGSIDLIVTSPPFLALRSYLPSDHPDKHREIGSEATPADFLDTLLALSAEWGRVLAPHGSLCVELGDTYSGSSAEGSDTRDLGKVSRGLADGVLNIKNGTGWPLAKSKTCIDTLYPACLAYGRNLLTGQPSPAGQWRIRNLIVWARPNPPVGALGDKFRPATSYITVACRSAKRYFDLDAVRGEPSPNTHARLAQGVNVAERAGKSADRDGNWSSLPELNATAGAPPLDWHADHHPEDGDWLWKLSTQPYAGSHYATFPMALPKRLIEAMCPLRVCTVCGRPSERIVEPTPEYAARPNAGRDFFGQEHDRGQGLSAPAAFRSGSDPSRNGASFNTIGWSDCGCPDIVPQPDADTPRPYAWVSPTGHTWIMGDDGSYPVTPTSYNDRQEAPGSSCRQGVSSAASAGSTPGASSRWRTGVVLDPFAGSGTTLEAAQAVGRHAIGIDLDARNADLARDRVGMFLTIDERATA